MPAIARQPDITVSTRRTWSRPRVECLQARPEVTAYSGGRDGDPLHESTWRPAAGAR
jgi:hypothetical protein